MNCPKCGIPMESVRHASIEVDRCTWCEGLWFDMLEAERLKELKAAGYIDVGDAILGEEYNLTAEADCPRCQVKLIPMVDAKQSHIWYESCPQCYGVFFDAGEFTDYQQETILDFFRGLLAKERG